MSLHISSAFDSGNAEIVEVHEPGEIRLLLQKDSQAEIRQWFHFRLIGGKGRDCRIQFLNAHEASYPDGFRDYQAQASYDRKNWFRVHTTFNGKILSIHHRPESETVWYAYFPPYSYERHLELIAMAALSPLASISSAALSTQGRDIERIIIGNLNTARHHIWITARQHPGESMAEWFMEGLIQKLLDPDQPISRELLKTCTFHLIPNMNPDGSVLGNLRTNANGVNLNREWLEPDAQRSPEVFGVRQLMFDHEPSLFLDIHGDEGLPYCFAAACEGIPSYTEKQRTLETSFLSHWEHASPEMQREFGYEKDEPGKADLSIASNWAGETFGCLSLTIEMPFKDNLACSEPLKGFSVERAKVFGQSVLQPIRAILSSL